MIDEAPELQNKRKSGLKEKKMPFKNKKEENPENPGNPARDLGFFYPTGIILESLESLP